MLHIMEYDAACGRNSIPLSWVAKEYVMATAWVADPNRWKALTILGFIQFILIVDLTVVNIALPEIQSSLDFSAEGLVWVVDGYALGAGGLLLLGGRMADLFGRRIVFLGGVAVFGMGSLLCGLAFAPELLIAGRFLQGFGEAFAAPASMGLVVVLFPDPGERIKALGVWGALQGIGGVSGTIISGLLTELASWRWVFLINIPIVLMVLILVPRLVPESRMVRSGTGRLNYTGVVLQAVGVAAIVYGILQAPQHGWLSGSALLPLAVGVLLIAGMVLVEHRADEPVIPLRFFTNRTRLTAYLVTVIQAATFIAYLFILSLYAQQVLMYSPLKAGLAYIPLGLAIGGGLAIATTFLPKFGVRALLTSAAVACGIGLLVATFTMRLEGSYWFVLVPGMVVVGIGVGMMLPSLTNAALHQTTGQDASLGSAVQTTTTHMGGAIGLAVFAAIAISQATESMDSGSTLREAAIDGYQLALIISAIAIFFAGLCVALLLDQGVETTMREPMAEIDADGQPMPAVD